MISIQSVSKQFEGVKAVQELSLDIKPGRITGFLGPNGAGKTTTLRMLMHIIQPDSGSIEFAGTPARPSPRKIGYLPEERGLYQKISVMETLQYFASLRSVSNAAGRINDYLKRFDLLERQHAKISELSKGNQQKIQFINTILHDPDFIVMDEPFSGLDPVNQLILKEILEELKQQGKTIVFSSHQMDQVERLCDDVALINSGKLILKGDLQTIRKDHATSYLKVVPMDPEDLQLDIFQTLGTVIRSGSALIEMGKRTSTEVISAVNAVCQLRSISVDEPGLEEIFIQHVRGRES